MVQYRTKISHIIIIFAVCIYSLIIIKKTCLVDIATPYHRFMRQVIDETIRLSTLAPYAARYSNKDAVVCGHTIKGWHTCDSSTWGGAKKP